MNKVLSKKKAMEIIAGFSKAGVLVIGDVMVDHFLWGKVSRISPEAPVPVVDVHADSFMLGGSANVLNSIHTLGGRGYITGVIGADSVGRGLIDELDSRGVDTTGMVVEKGRPTTLKTRIVAHNQQVVRFDQESKKPVSSASLKKMISYVGAVSPKIRAIIISDYNKGVVSRALVESLASIAAKDDIFICVDPKQNDFSIYAGVDVITPNHHEAQRAAGMEIQNGDDLMLLGQTLLSKYDFRTLLVTRGEEGMSLFERERKVLHTHFSAQAKEVYDVTGAGDTVIGVLALALSAGATMKEATCLANIAAGIVVGKVGTAAVSREELIGVL